MMSHIAEFKKIKNLNDIFSNVEVNYISPVYELFMNQLNM